MALNSTSSDSLLFSEPRRGLYCLSIRPSSLIFNAYFIAHILLLLPLCILVLYLGLQRRQRQRSNSAKAASSHSDVFTYHVVAMELIGVSGCALCCFGIFLDHAYEINVGIFLWSLTWMGEMHFHMLTCVERYLAVVHPVTYMSLRGERGITIRNISVGCVWLLYFAAIKLVMSEALIVDLCLQILSLVVVLICNLSVLYVLIRPGPGDQGGDRERVDQTKRRAFYTIVAILGVLSLRCLAGVVWTAVHMYALDCIISTMTELWLNLPGSLVLPLLFVHRAGTLVCCKSNI